MASDARFVRADRTQTRWDFVDLDALVPSDHRARIVMGFVESLDLSPLYGAIKAREGHDARRPIPPFCWRFGFMRRSREWVRYSLNGLPSMILPTAGSPAGCRSTITGFRTSGRMWRFSIGF